MAGAINLKNGIILGALSSSFVAAPFLIGRGEKHLFDLNKVSGLRTRVGIFLEWMPNKDTQTTSATGGNTQSREGYNIIQVSQEQAKSQQNKKRPDLIAELLLDNLSSPVYWKACIPEGSLLLEKSTNNQTSTNNLAANNGSASNKNLCQTKWLFEFYGDRNFDTVRELLNRTSQFLQVESSYHRLLPKNEIVNFFEGKKKTQGQSSEVIKNLKEACKLSSDDLKDVFKDLFAGTPKDCFLSPVGMRFNVQLNKNNSTNSRISQQSTNDNERIWYEYVTNGSFTGRIDYSLFDYHSGTKKAIKKDSTNKFPTFSFRSKNKYVVKDADPKNCKLGLEDLLKKVDVGSLKLDDLLMDTKCYV